MKGFNRKKGIWIGIAAVIIALIAAVSAYAGHSSNDSMSDASNRLLHPLKSLASSVVQVFENMYSRSYEYDKLLEENEELRAELAAYEKNYRDYTELEKENEEYSALLGFSKKNPDQIYAEARVESWTASNYTSSFQITEGSDEGIAVGNAVIDKNGYYLGVVTSVSASSATVMTAIDTKSSLSAGLYTTSSECVAQGDFTLMSQGLFKLMYLPEDSNIASGDTVFTSGGSVPDGLIIGYVEDIRLSESGLDDYAILSPAVNYAQLDRVYIITGIEEAV